MVSEVSQIIEITCVYHKTIIDVCLQKLIKTLYNLATTNRDAEEIMIKFFCFKSFLLLLLLYCSVVGGSSYFISYVVMYKL